MSGGNWASIPIEAALQDTGKIAVVFLVLTLAVTPIRKLFKFPLIRHVRKPLGLYAAFYAVLHFLIFRLVGLRVGFWADLGGNRDQALHYHWLDRIADLVGAVRDVFPLFSAQDGQGLGPAASADLFSGDIGHCAFPAGGQRKPIDLSRGICSAADFRRDPVGLTGFSAAVYKQVNEVGLYISERKYLSSDERA